MENLIKIHQEWQHKLKNAKNDFERQIILGRLKKIDDQLHQSHHHPLDNNGPDTSNYAPELETNTNRVDYFSEKLNENFYWDRLTQTAVFDSGPVYSADEIADLHSNDNSDNAMLKCIHAIKRSFPQTKWIGTFEYVEQSTQEDELDILFKDLKG